MSSQPSILLINSDDCPLGLSESGSTAQFGENDTYSQFSIQLNQSIVGCKGIQLASFVQANVPGDGPNIPDYQAALIGFMYYKNANGTANEMGTGTLFMMPLLSSVSQVSNPEETGFNRAYSSYADFVSVLNAASVFLGAGPAGGPDLIFGFDTVSQKIWVQGTDPTKYYCPAGFSDAAVNTWISSNVHTNHYNPIPLGMTLNLRVGFANQYFNLNQCLQGAATVIAANQIWPYGYPDLTRTSAISVHVNFSSGNSIDTLGRRDIIDRIPINVPFLGVMNYQPKLPVLLDDIPLNIDQLNISFTDDAGLPYLVSNAVSTLLSINCFY